MQVPVTLPHQPGGEAPVQPGPLGGEHLRRAGDHPLRRLGSEDRCQLPQVGGVGGQHIVEAVRPAPGRAQGRGPVDPGDLPADGLGQVPVHPVGALAQHRGLVEAAHFQHIVHGLGGVGRGEAEAVGPGHHRMQGPIDVRRGDPVQAQLLLPRPQALFQGGEVQEAEIHRLLPLQGPVGIEIDLGDRRLDPPVAGAGLPCPGRQPLVEIVALHPPAPRPTVVAPCPSECRGQGQGMRGTPSHFFRCLQMICHPSSHDPVDPTVRAHDGQDPRTGPQTLE